MGIRGIPIPLIAEPQFSALPYPYAKKGQPSNRLAVFSRFQGCSAGGKLPMVSWEAAAALCAVSWGAAAAPAGNGRSAYAYAKAEPPFSAWPYPYVKHTLKKDSQANRLAVLSRFQGWSGGGKLPISGKPSSPTHSASPSREFHRASGSRGNFCRSL